MKTLGIGAVILVAAALLVLFGYWLGAQHRMLTELYSIATVDKALTDASVKAMLIEQIDSGRPNDAREHLELQLAGDILIVDSLLDSSDARTRELAQKVFARIASYRQAHPASSGKPLVDADVDAKIASILDRAKKASSK